MRLVVSPARRATDPFFYVRGDEQVILRAGAARGYGVLWFLILAAASAALAVVGVVLAARFSGGAVPPAWVVGAWAALLPAFALAAWRRQATAENVLTDARIYARVGRMLTKVHLATHDKVTDVHYRQGPLMRLLGVAELTFSTAGGDVRVRGLADALAFKEAAERARDEYVRRLLERAGVESAARRAAAQAEPQPSEPSSSAFLPEGGRGAPADAVAWSGPRPAYVKEGDVPAWQARPRLVSALGAVKSVAPFVAFAVVAQLVQGSGRSPVGGLLVPLAIGIVVVAFGASALQLSRTEYLATDRRAYARSGVVGTTVRQLTYDKITDITFEQDVLGRLLGYGTVTLATAGGGGSAIHLRGLSEPLKAKEAIEALRGRYLREANA